MYFLILSSKISCVGRSFEFFVRGKILFYSMEISTCCREEGFNKRFQGILFFFWIILEVKKMEILYYVRVR